MYLNIPSSAIKKIALKIYAEFTFVTRRPQTLFTADKSVAKMLIWKYKKTGEESIASKFVLISFIVSSTFLSHSLARFV